MRIDLFMANFAHDRIEKSSKNSDVLGGWLHGGMQKPGMEAFAGAMSAEYVGDFLPHLLIRKESWGGLVFDGRSQAIYEVDEEAFDLFSMIKNGKSLEGLKALGVKNIDYFISILNKYEIA